MTMPTRWQREFTTHYNGGTPTPYSIACTHNLFIQRFFDTVTVDTRVTKYLLSEFGAVLAITAAITSMFDRA